MSSRTFDLVSRGGWGARPPRSAVATNAQETFLHHTVGSDGASYMRAIQDFHMDIKGWADVAYNFVIDPRTLVVYEGRGWGVRPAAQRNYNSATWAVAVMGDFRSRVPSRGVLDTIAALTRHGHQLGFLPLVLTGGHRDAPGQSTSCPGDNLATAIPTIRSLLTSPGGEALLPLMYGHGYEQAPSDALAKGDQSHRVEDVRALQDLLNFLGAGLTLDGLYGPSTIAAVKAKTGGNTGHPDGKEGRWFGGNQYGNLLLDVAKTAGGQGPEGPPGPQGPRGPKGEQGPPATLTITGDAQLP